MRKSDCWNKQNHEEILDYTSSMLWRYINKNSAESTTEEAFLKLTALKRDDLMCLFEIRLLLSDDIMYFINKVILGIVNRLSKETLNKTIVLRNKIVGKVDWQKTLLTQTLAGSDKTLFVTKTISNKFDLPENRLLKFIIELINKIAKKYITDIARNMWYEELTSTDKWTEKVKYVYSKTQSMLKNPIVKQISRISEITEKMIIATRYQRNMFYGDLAKLAEKILQGTENPYEYLRNELGNKILEPLNRDDLFEIAVLFKVIEAIQSTGWDENEVGLIGGRRRYTSKFNKGENSLKVYYQKLPTGLKDKSKYTPLMIKYGLSDRSRRPDIVIELKQDNRVEYLIVEVKRSQNARYLSDGVYKVFGYLKDYEEVEDEVTGIEGILIGWKGIEKYVYDNNTKVNIFEWKDVCLGISGYFNNKTDRNHTEKSMKKCSSSSL